MHLLLLLALDPDERVRVNGTGGARDGGRGL
jgi:hypothetical protein